MAQRVYPLSEVIASSQSILKGWVVARKDSPPRFLVQTKEAIKGQLSLGWVDVDATPCGWGHRDTILRRVAPGLPVLLFTTRVGQRDVAMVFTQGTWFQISGDADDSGARVTWTLTRGEPYLRRTFSKGTAELEKVVRDVVARRADAPLPNPGGGQGFGPEPPGDLKPAAPLPPIPAAYAATYGPARVTSAVTPATVAKPKGVPDRDLPALEAISRETQRPVPELAALYRRAHGSLTDVRMAAVLARDLGRGGDRAWVRSPAEILALKQRSDRLTWLDVKGCLQRAGELFRPVDDAVDLIFRLRQRLSWDELDPMLDSDKWGRRKLDDSVSAVLKGRLSHPLLPGDRLGPATRAACFSAPAMVGPRTGTLGWAVPPDAPRNLPRLWRRTDSPASAPVLRAPGCQQGEFRSRPPEPGAPLAGGAGPYPGTALWIANGVGDLEGRNPAGEGAAAYFDGGWIEVAPGTSRSFLVELQLYTPDHSLEVGEPRDGWFYIRRPSRAVWVGLRLADRSSLATALGPGQLQVPLETAPNRFERVLLRGDVKQDVVSVIAFISGVGEVGRASARVQSAKGLALAPMVSLRRPQDGSAVECFVAGLRELPINAPSLQVTQGPVATAEAERLRQGPPALAAAPAKVPPPGSPPAHVAALKPPSVVQAEPASPSAQLNRLLGRRPRRLVLAVDHSGSMQPRLAQARTLCRDLMDRLSPQDEVCLVAWDTSVVPLTPGWLPANQANLTALAHSLDGIGTGSGTDLGLLLQKVLPLKPTAVVLVSDGEPPSRGVTDPIALLKLKKELNVSKAALHLIALGQERELPNENLERRIAESTGGQLVLASQLGR
jgi:hypothetical protein